MNKICPLFRMKRDYNYECNQENCAIWDDENNCCSYKRITKKPPEVAPLTDYSKTDTPIYNPIITATPDPPGYTHPQVWYETEV